MMVECTINNVPVTFELDSGSQLSTINTNYLNKLDKPVIKPTAKKGKGYGNNIIQFLGEVSLSVQYNDAEITHKFLVVPNNTVSLFGRDLCEKLNFNIAIPYNNNCNKLNFPVLEKYSDYLSDNFVSNVKDKVSFSINSDVIPIYHKARPVPLRMKELVKNELDRLEANNIITKVYQSDWACPTVNIMKPNNQVRIAGD